MDRRAFFADLKTKITTWAPWLGPLGLRVRPHVYRASTGPYTVRWVEWYGKAVGWLDDAGRIIWL